MNCDERHAVQQWRIDGKTPSLLSPNRWTYGHRVTVCGDPSDGGGPTMDPRCVCGGHTMKSHIPEVISGTLNVVLNVVWNTHRTNFESILQLC